MDAGEPRSANLRRALRSSVKEAVWLIGRHTPGELNDIGLFATRRGGSTWLMEVIAASEGCRPLDQPFSVGTANLTPGHYRTMPKYLDGQIVCPSADQLERLTPYVDSLLAGDIPVNAPFRIWSRGYRRTTSRQVLKIVGAKSIICWLDDEFDIDVVYLTRHPITQALSCLRNDWTLTVRAYLDNPRFIDSYLTGGLEGKCHDILTTGTELDRFVLNWGLENLIAMRSMPDRQDWTHVSYEATVMRPVETVSMLADRLSLGDPSRLLDSAQRPSRSSGLSTRERRAAIHSGDGDLLVRSPLESVSLAHRSSAMRILDDLEVGIYRPDEIEPIIGR